MVTPVVIGALGAVLESVEDRMKNVRAAVKLQGIRKNTLLGTARIIKNVVYLNYTPEKCAKLYTQYIFRKTNRSRGKY